LLSDLANQEKEFLDKVKEILDEANKRNVTMRVMGALAFRIHCPKFKFLIYSANRYLTDLDFAAYMKDADKISRLLEGLGYKEILAVRCYLGGTRRLFQNPVNKMKVDVFLDKLRMCHDINFVGRLEIDYPTISIVDLLLEKMQIVELDAKDIIDTITLIREHDVGESDSETINIEYLASLCASDWGLWMTTTTNLNKVKSFLPEFEVLSDEDRRDVEEKIKKILEIIEKKPKSIQWKMRAKIGIKKKWYRTVETPH
jgi:hypothetical protein